MSAYARLWDYPELRTGPVLSPSGYLAAMRKAVFAGLLLVAAGETAGYFIAQLGLRVELGPMFVFIVLSVLYFEPLSREAGIGIFGNRLVIPMATGLGFWIGVLHALLGLTNPLYGLALTVLTVLVTTYSWRKNLSDGPAGKRWEGAYSLTIVNCLLLVVAAFFVCVALGIPPAAMVTLSFGMLLAAWVLYQMMRGLNLAYCQENAYAAAAAIYWDIAYTVACRLSPSFRRRSRIHFTNGSGN